jgi:GAF domain-containing protein
MLIQEDPVGLIVAVNKIEGDRFSDGDLRLAEAFADPAAIALDSSERAARGTPHRPQTSRVTRQSDLRGRETEVLRLVALGFEQCRSRGAPGR